MVLLLAVCIGISILGLLWLRRRGAKWRLRQLSAALPVAVRAGAGRSAGIKWLMKVYRLMKQGVAAADSKAAYGAADILKLAFGEGLMRPDEPARLAGIIVGTLRANQPETACFILDAYRPLLKRLAVPALPAAAEQLSFIAAVALKLRHNSVAARAADYLFMAIDRADKASDQAAAKACFTAITAVGLMALKRGDDSFFREIFIQLDNFLAAAKLPALTAELPPALGRWLHKIITDQNLELWLLVSDLCTRISDQNIITPADQGALLKNCLDCAGSASLNLDNKLVPVVLDYCLSFAHRRQSFEHWRLTIAGAGRIIAVAIGEYGLTAAIPLAAPLFACGCRLMQRQLKSSYADADAVNMRALHLIVRECLTLLELTARQQMSVSISELIGLILLNWPVVQNGVSVPKLAKFCQMLLVYRAENRRKTKRRQAEEQSVGAELTAADRAKFYFLRPGG